MLGWAQSHPDEPFYSKILTGEFAPRQVKSLASTCHRQYGVFDTHALDRLMGTEIAKQDFEELLLSSEMTVGTWIITYKMLHSGNVAETLFKKKELDLHPYWLAIEPSYSNQILFSHIARPDPNLPELIQKHRWQTTHILGNLKRNTKAAAAVFHMRGTIMPRAIRRVLALRGFQASSFKIKTNEVITSSIKFWIGLAVAIQHLECLNLVDGFPSAFDST